MAAAPSSKDGTTASGRPVPFHHLHRLARLLASTQPRTKLLFRRLRAVIAAIRGVGGTVRVWEWNALIDCAGKGTRSPTYVDYQAALAVFKDMLDQSGASVSNERGDGDVATQPDIVTFTTLIDIASRTREQRALDHATSLLQASTLPWTPVTRMAQLHIYIKGGHLGMVQQVMQDMSHEPPTLYIVNGLIWAFGRNKELGIAFQVYRHLRNNISPELLRRTHEEFLGPDGTPHRLMSPAHNPILDTFHIPSDMVPNDITYISVIQALCYHGDFTTALSVFKSMLDTVDTTSLGPGMAAADGRCFQPSYPIFRAFFLGFARHGDSSSIASRLISRRVDEPSYRQPLSDFASHIAVLNSPGEHQPLLASTGNPWTLDALDALFESFMHLDWPQETKGFPSERTIYWIMMAYAKVTRSNPEKMFVAWNQLAERHGTAHSGELLWNGRLARIAQDMQRYAATQGKPS